MTGQAHDDREHQELKPRILVFGVGGAGGNAVRNMVAANLEGVEFVVANTDSQALTRARAEHRFQLGPSVTEGLGAGAKPEVGKRAAEDSLAEIAKRVSGAHMVFVTAGMGGGTGTGAAPVIAKAAREAGALVVAVVTKPFDFEGAKRMRVALDGVKELEREVDTLILIPNQNLFRMATEKTSIADAFAMADEVLHSAVRGVTDLMTRPGVVNLDFADVRTVMGEMGKAVMGAGEAEGARRAADAANAAVANPLLDDITLKGAKAALINITGGPGLTLYDIDEAANTIRAEVDSDANIIVGSAIDESLGERVRVSVLATGIQAGARSVATRRALSQREAAPERGLSKAAAAGFTFEPPARPKAPEPAAPEPAREPEASEEPLELVDKVPDPPVDDPDAPASEDAPDAAGAVEAMPLTFGSQTADEHDADARPAGFSLFGRRRRREPDAEPRAAAGEPWEGDAEEADDELEIPAFLRRQAN